MTAAVCRATAVASPAVAVRTPAHTLQHPKWWAQCEHARATATDPTSVACAFTHVAEGSSSVYPLAAVPSGSVSHNHSKESRKVRRDTGLYHT